MQNITFTNISVKEDGVQILEKDVVVQCALEMPGTLQHRLRASQGSWPELAVLEPAGWNFGNFFMNHAFVYSKIIPSYLPMQIIKETLIVILDIVELTCAMVDHTIPGELCQNCHQENCLTYFFTTNLIVCYNLSYCDPFCFSWQNIRELWKSVAPPQQWWQSGCSDLLSWSTLPGEIPSNSK